MLKNDLILRNPLRMLGAEQNELVPSGGFGAVLARAGVGKTAFLVQIALNTLLREGNVLHISLTDPVNKVSLWYQEVFHHLAHAYDAGQVQMLWETIQSHRFIMTYRAEAFTVETLQERMTDLSAQGIFNPQMLIIDGLPFEAGTESQLQALKAMARANDLQVWFTVTTHRHEKPAPDGLPVQLRDVEGLFEVAIQLQPEGKEIHVRPLKGVSQPAPLQLDPSTMLLKNSDGA